MTEKQANGIIIGVFVGTALMALVWAFEAVADLPRDRQPEAQTIEGGRGKVEYRSYGQQPTGVPYEWPDVQPPRSYPAGPTGIPQAGPGAQPQAEHTSPPWYAVTVPGPATRTPLPTWTYQPPQPTATDWPTFPPRPTLPPTPTDCGCVILTYTPTP